MWGLVAVLALVGLLAEWLWFNLVRRTAPGPWGLPVVGSLIDFLRNQNRLVQSFDHLGRAYGLVVCYRVLGLGTIVQTNDSADVAHILNTAFDKYPKPQLLADTFGTLFGEGIFAQNGQPWIEQRKAGSQGFKLRSIKRSVEIFGGETLKALQLLEEHDGEEVDVMKLLASLTLSGFTSLALSEDNFSEVRLNDDSPFALHFNRAVKNAAHRFQNPLWKLGPTVWRGERELQESMAFIDAEIFKVVAKARQRTGAEPEDMISAFLHYIPHASDRYLRDILFNFILAGRDTTAITLAMTMHFLAEHPEVQEKLFREVSRVSGDVPSYEELDSFPYLIAVVNETLRLAPAVPVDPKVALEDDVLPGSGVRVHKGDNVEWSAWSLGRRKEHFGEDCMEYRPERWIENDSLPKTNRPPFVPFQFGPRTCLGMRMALCDMYAVLIMLVRRFRVSSVGFKPQQNVLVTLVVDQVRVKVHVRS